MPQGLKFAVLALIAGLVLVSSEALAADHVIKMKNDNGKGAYMVFEPDFLKVAVGDTITFEPVDPGHDAETIPEIWPDGVPHVQGQLSKPVSFTVTKDGVYGIKCAPHFAFGMMALIVAGKPVNAAQVDAFKAPPMAQKRFEALKAEFDAAK